MGRHHEEQSLALFGEIRQRSSGDERWGERHSGQKYRILVLSIDRIHDLSFIGPEPDAKSFFCHVLGESGAPGAGTDHSNTIDYLHIEKRRPTGCVRTNRVCGSVIWRADYRNLPFPLSMKRLGQGPYKATV
jgi:hypothetical protein